MATGQTKLKDKDEGILGDGLAELARKQLRDRQARFDEILGDTPKSTEPKKPVSAKMETKRFGQI